MSHYTGKEGAEYFLHREGLRAPAVQQRQSAAFARHIVPDWTVLDFGCGTGDILAGLPCRIKIGVEINEPSVRRANEHGITVHGSLEPIAAGSVDAVIANHSIEHVPDPTGTLNAFHRVLKAGGLLLIVVPAENPYAAQFRAWHEEMNRHLFSWTPLSLGNLVRSCGFRVDYAEITTPARAGRYTDLVRCWQPAHRAALHLRWLLTADYDITCVAHTMERTSDLSRNR